MSIVTSYSQTYYDDFNESKNADKNYLRILFKPGYSVQVREINQLQTILQEQINRLGSSVWKDDTAVIGGETTFLEKIYSITLNISPSIQVTDGLTIYNYRQVLEKAEYITHTNGLKAKIYDYKDVTTGSNPDGTKQIRFYITYENSAQSLTGENIREFLDVGNSNIVYNIRLTKATPTTNAPTTIALSAASIGLAFGFSCASGVFYTRGSFVAAPQQYLFVDKASLSDVVNGYAVLLAEETQVSATEDASLYDNAAGTPNYTAPGADRYQINLTLKWYTKSEFDTIKNTPVTNRGFIKLLFIENSRAKEFIITDKYKEINSILAQRTKEESGNYALNPFITRVRELYDGSELPATCIANGKRYTIQELGNTLWSTVGAGSSPSVGHTFIASADAASTIGDGKVLERGFVYGRYKADDLDLAGYQVATLSQKREAINSAKDKFNITIEPSTAYVDGNRVELKSPLDISVSKARGDDHIIESELSLSSNIGSYFIGAISGTSLPNIGTVTAIYDLKNTGNTKIGACKIKSIEAIAGSTNYRCYVYDVSFENTALYRFDDIKTITDNSFTFTIDASQSALNENTSTLGYFTLPYHTANDITKFSYYGKKYFFGNTVASTGNYEKLTVSLPAGGGEFSNFEDSVIVVNGNVFTYGSGANKTWRYVTNSPTSKTIESQDFGTNSNFHVISSIRFVNAISVPKIVDTITETIVLSENNTASIFKLSKPDAINLRKVVRGNNIDVGVDTTSMFELFDDGQRDDHYTNARIRYTGAGTVSSSITVQYDYLRRNASPNNSIFYTAKSYKDIDRNNMPAYKGRFLSDVIDFRPDLVYSGVLTNQNSTTLISNSNNIVIDPNTAMDITAKFYLSRIDKLVVHSNNSFSVVPGIPSFTPTAPETPPGAMALYTITIPAYTANINDITMQYIDNRRYTMRDIGDIESRIRNIEYYTSLSLLERSANDKSIFDDDGLRFKNGILVDNFIGHGVGNVFDKRYKCSVDRKNNILRPLTKSKNIDMPLKSLVSSNGLIDSGKLKLHHSTITLNYDEVELISQLQSTNTISVQPHLLAKVEGNIVLSPSSDNWKETTVQPDLVIQDDSAFDAIKYIASDPNVDILGYDFQHWETYQTTILNTSVDVDVVTKAGPDPSRPNVNRQVITTKTTTEDLKIDQSRTGTFTTLTSTNVNQSIGEYLRDVSLIPYIRSRRVYFYASGFLPNTRLYPFFDKKDISGYTQSLPKSAFTTPGQQAQDRSIMPEFKGLFPKDLPVKLPGVPLNENGVPVKTRDESIPRTVFAEELITDESGVVCGSFIIPNNDILKFNTGERIFRLTDDKRNDDEDTNTFGEALYVANGLSTTSQETIISTKVPQFNVTNITQKRTVFDQHVQVDVNTVTYKDPLAQSFVIEKSTYKEGVFVTSVDLFFSKKGTTAPVWISLLTMKNGYPTNTVIPYSTVEKLPSQVNVSDDATLATTFTFINPVYLKSNDEYCIYIQSFDPAYECHYCIYGKKDILTGAPIIPQDYLGVFFTSSNSQTWTAYQDRDLKFRIRRAKFKSSTNALPASGEVQFERSLHTGISKIEFVDDGNGNDGRGSKYTRPPIVVITPDGDEVSTPDPATAVAEIDPITQKLTKIVITKRGSGYTLPPLVSIVSVAGGGGPNPAEGDALPAAAAFLESVSVSMYNLKQSAMIPSSTSLTNKIEFGGEDAVFINNNETHYIPNSYLANNNIPTNSNILTNDSNKTVVLTSKLFTSDDSISPVIDLDGTSLITVENIINNDSTNEGLNVHVNSTATSGTVSTLTDTRKEWIVNEWSAIKPSKLKITGGTGAGKVFTITANSANTLTFTPAASPPLDNTSQYIIVDNINTLDGNAVARYITRKVDLNNPSDRLNIYISANRPTENTNINVYVKFGYDKFTSDDQLDWELVLPTSPIVVSSNSKQYKEVEYIANPLTDFISFQVKIVFLSNNIVDVPTVRDFRAIATI